MIQHYFHAPWQQPTGDDFLVAPRRSALDRRAFVRSGLVATAAAVAAVPAGGLWAKPVLKGSGLAAIPDEMAAIALNGKSLALKRADIRALRDALKGQVLLAQDEGYDSARRIWDTSFDRRPALIARCANAQDVMQAVDFARSSGIRTAVRAGGHSHSGMSQPEGGLMIDMTAINEVRVDAAAREARAGGGTLLGGLDRPAQAAGFAVTLGTDTGTGIAGLTLGGGMGRLMRQFGLTIDNLLSADVVTADGKLRHASARENPELFWGIRGGGGNFGIVTDFRYRVHPFARPVMDGFRGFRYDPKQARAFYATMAELAARAPDDLMLGAAIVNSVPPGGKALVRSMVLSVSYTGVDFDRINTMLAAFDKFGPPVFDSIAVMPYLKAQRAEGAANVIVPTKVQMFSETGFLREMQPEMIDELVQRFEAMPGDIGMMAAIGQLGGAVSRVAPDATAYWNRSAKFQFYVTASWSDPARGAVSREAAQAIWAGVEEYTEGYYINMLDHEEDQRLRANFGGNFKRLVKLKRKVDPGNLFRMNANIKPDAV
ncbi:MAG: FAD-binding oxidoreductase [Sphingomonas sp.]|uniref:FAD-binding oxidoreductase n=1 Tax=Sphingomonas sp. TaxID=28214 RepID=UPI0025EE1891|nr:FAD-binding oxidoreductase [Sphingomonas sp.]MBX3563557.1 FAD-binding oxidoreductase [Sphingomonas sp.]